MTDRDCSFRLGHKGGGSSNGFQLRVHQICATKVLEADGFVSVITEKLYALACAMPRAWASEGHTASLNSLHPEANPQIPT